MRGKILPVCVGLAAFMVTYGLLNYGLFASVHVPTGQGTEAVKPGKLDAVKQMAVVSGGTVLGAPVVAVSALKEGLAWEIPFLRPLVRYQRQVQLKIRLDMAEEEAWLDLEKRAAVDSVERRALQEAEAGLFPPATNAPEGNEQGQEQDTQTEARPPWRGGLRFGVPGQRGSR